MNNANKTEWMSDPLIANIDPYKLEFLQALVFESSSLNRDQMLPFLMAVAKRGKDKNITFSDEEMDAVVTVLKNHASAEELDKINKVMAMRKTRSKK